ncbi:hypothetical protein AVEN_77942-1 [Araneus ventricosus]|uniref:Endonuclease/exonuclease/phosphatase domain-containing protein n=1 Tax=Araneus ventricosus TaxID=182803 RepID=A0A4Y2DUP1_ARAVE|nr:hypothetical protein AVEN_77942-1 [Araneus ventricosus]
MTFFYSHRQDRSGGGLLTGIPKTAAGRIMPTSFSDHTNLEILAIEIHFNNHKFIIVNLYAPQGLDIQQAKSFFEPSHHFEEFQPSPSNVGF